jgi:hypothetical protein
MKADVEIVNNLSKKLGLSEIRLEEDEMPEEVDERLFWDIEAVGNTTQPNMANLATRKRNPVSIASGGTGGK